MDKLIKIAYDNLDNETRKQLGRSSDSEIAVINENAIVHYFENGSLIYDRKRKYTFSIFGTLFVFWKKLGGLESFLGLPISGVKTEMVEGHEGSTVTFQNGSIYYVPFYPKDEELYVKFSIPVIRPDDMLALIFEFINLKPVTDLKKNVVLESVSRSRNSYINLFFPQQSIAEEAFGDPLKNGQVLSDAPIKSRISGLSRLSFVVPNKDKIPLNLDSLLEKCEAYDLSVDSLARPPENYLSTSNELDFDFVKKAGISSQLSIKDLNVKDVQTNEHLNKMLGRLRSDLSKKTKYDVLKINQDYRSVFEKVNKDILDGLKLIGTPHYTKIEAPYKFIISPNRYAHWKYLSNPKQDISSISGRVALWHTQLSTKSKINGIEIDEGQKEYFKTIRAIASKNGNPFTVNSLDQKDRKDIVDLTSNFELKDDPNGQFKLEPVEARQLMLTPLGASLNFFGKWDYCKSKKNPFSLINWVHNATMARDHYVKVVRKGVLYPLGHKAVYIKITERKFHPGKLGNTAYLRQREFIVVIEPEKFHRNDDSLPAQKYQFPFNSTQIVSLVTPNLDLIPEEEKLTACPSDNPRTDGRDHFWPKVSGKRFLFNVIGEDLIGKTTEWSMPLIFVDETCIDNVNMYKEMYDSQEIDIDGQTITYAEPLDNDNTALETKKLTFNAVVDTPTIHNFPGINIPFHEINTPIIVSRDATTINTTGINEIFRPHLHDVTDATGITVVPVDEEKIKSCKDRLPFSPVVEKAEIVLPAIKHLLGNEQSAEFKYADVYKSHGFASTNPMGKFFEAVANGIDLSFGENGNGDKAGGLIKPDMSIKGLTRESAGFIGGGANLNSENKFNPAEFFGNAEDGPKLFGIFNLFDILKPFNIAEAPKFITKTLENVDDAQKVIEEKTIELEWNPKLKEYPGSNDILPPAIFEPIDKEMNISVKIRAESNGDKQPGIEIYSKIKKFNINIIGTGDLHFLTLEFDKIEFKSASGKKPEVDVQFKDIQFAGPLNFVNTLTDIIPFDGFSDPPNIDVTPNGISAGFSLEIPAITVGVFSLQNLMLGANFTVPFINDPITVKFFFCERHEPFLLTVYVFGGGGFFTLTVTPEGFYMLEAGFEFGLCLAMNFGVAKGSVKAMGGVYFSIVKNSDNKNEVTLIGYFHISGEVDVLGLISASILLALDLIYETAGNKVTGEASITIEVEVLFFSATVQVKCKKQFAGAKGDPVFAQIMDTYVDEDGEEHDPWREYCEAFA